MPIQEQSTSELVMSVIYKKYGTTDWLYPGC